ncbi:MAG: flagellar basal-body MS-ring/collar protein FliF [Bacteriovoracia bacterium]
MTEYFKKVFRQLGEFFTALSPGRKLALGVVSVAVLAGVFAMFQWAGSQTYRPLMTNLNPEDSANVMRVLRQKQIPFKVDQSGRNIEIPPESVFDLRMELATLGLPQSSVVGYEVFDHQSLGTTSLVQRINMLRAKEGELMRTIGAIKGVKRARVHLAIPKESTFIQDQKEPTASVVLDLEPSVRLSEKQVFGIGNLVASAVEGLDIGKVVIVDSTGRTLSENTRDPLVQASATQLDFRRKLEESMEKRVEEMLSPVVGEGHVVARVSAELDFSQVSETQTTFDADGSAVRSAYKNNDSMSGSRPAPGGVAGVRANTPGEQPGVQAAQVKTDTQKVHETTNFEVPQTIRQTRKPSGTVSRLSVSVVVDGRQVKDPEKPDAKAKVEPWSEDKLKEFEQIIAGAVGLNPKRGDTIQIKNMEFNRADFSEAEKQIQDSERRSYLQNMMVYSVIGLLIILFFLFVIRPFIKWVTENTTDSVDTFLPQTIEELEKLQKAQNLPVDEVVPELPEQIDPEKIEGEMIKEKIVTLVDANPHKAALILRDWVRGEKKAPEGEEAKDGADKTA